MSEKEKSQIEFEDKCNVFVSEKYYEVKSLAKNLKWRITPVILQKKSKFRVHIKTFPFENRGIG